MTDGRPLCCVLIPFQAVHSTMEHCLARLTACPLDMRICLIADGTECSESALDRLSPDPRVVVLRLNRRRGPGAARNLGIRWCRTQGIDLIVLLDSDCVPDPGFIEEHIRLHEKFTHAACIGCGIRGTGKGAWAAIDGMASWFTSIPELGARSVGSVYHIPTTNMSFKLSRLAMRHNLFDETLRTGEDIMFLKHLRESRVQMLYEPRPVVCHHDRERFTDMIMHQFRWALHTYPVRSGNTGTPFYRLFLALIQVPLAPFTALAMTTLNLWPWIRVSWKYMWFSPALYLLYLIKSAGIIAGTIAPGLALRQREEAEDKP
jgi:glycosyltransferase involved in cell wall biosynthesis